MKSITREVTTHIRNAQGGPLQAHNQDFMWWGGGGGGANEAKVDQSTEMYFLLSEPFI